MAGPKLSAASASSYATSHLSLSVLTLLSSAGFSKSSSTAAHLLTEVLQRYVQLIGTTCVQHANHSGRNVVAPQDLCAALELIMGGDPVEEVLQWAEDEGRLELEEAATDAANLTESDAQTAQLPPDSAQPQPNGAGDRAPSAANQLPSAQPQDPLRDPQRGKDLRKRLMVGRHQPVDNDPTAEIHYVPIPPRDYEILAEQSFRRERRIERLVWNGFDADGSSRAGVKAGKRKAVDPNAMDIDDEVEPLATRRNSRSGSTTASEDDDDSASSGAESSTSSSNSTSWPSSRSRNASRASRSLTRSPARRRKRSHSNDGHHPPESLALSSDSTVLRKFGSLEIDYVPSYLPAFPPDPLTPTSTPHAGKTRQPDPAAASTALRIKGEAAPDDDTMAIPAPQDTDLEHIEQERLRIEAAQRAARAATDAAAAAARAANGVASSDQQPELKPEPTAEQRAAETEQVLEALQQRSVLRDCWKEAIPFDSSTLGAAYPKAELDSVEQAVADLSSNDELVSIAPSTSSLRAFAADFQALVDDPLTSGAAGVYLTPSGAAYQDAASKRRRLAFGLADPARYSPNDSLYGAVGARPVMLPFQPGPSWLVSTLPPPTLYEDNDEVAAALSAPILTPVLPQGRPAALIPPSGSLVPPLAYRHPSHLSIAARIVSNAELLKRVSRFEDPPPLLDDKHAERFFHGLPASRDLVGGSSSSSDLSSNISQSRNGGGGSGSGNTTLRAALEKLVLQLKEKEAVVLPEEDKEELQRRQQELQLQLQAQAAENAGDGASGGPGRGKGEGVAGLIGDSYASRIRNGNITMVHTWDWAMRDPFDPSLPGRRVRGLGEAKAGTAPVAVERERGRKKRESSTHGSLGAATEWNVEEGGAVNGSG
ncbi:hypothetical protein ACQY0O_001242 [Thecaphora frezii]